MVYLMGIDGGGSMVWVVITASDLGVQGQSQGPAANPSIVGQDIAAQSIQATMYRALNESNLSPGQIAAVGFDLYCRLIQETIQELKGEALPSPVDPAVRLPAEALLPDAYVDDPAIRLALYKRLAAAEAEAALEELGAELRDRFGPLPPEATWLLTGMALRLAARRLRAVEVDLRSPTVRLRLGPRPAVDGAAAAALLREAGGRLRYGPGDTLTWRSGEGDAAARAAAVRNLLRRLMGTW